MAGCKIQDGGAHGQNQLLENFSGNFFYCVYASKIR
jgi:hypothetical protein